MKRTNLQRKRCNGFFLFIPNTLNNSKPIRQVINHIAHRLPKPLKHQIMLLVLAVNQIHVSL